MHQTEKVVTNLVEEKKGRKEVSIQHVDLHLQDVKVKEKEKTGVKKVQKNL